MVGCLKSRRFVVHYCDLVLHLDFTEHILSAPCE